MHRLLLLHIVFWSISVGFTQSSSTKKLEKEWKNSKENIRYERAQKYKGPVDWYTDQPAPIEQQEVEDYQDYQGLQYSPQQIQRNRALRKKTTDRGGSYGTEDFEPEITPPDIDPPDVDVPDTDPPTISDRVWKILGFIFLFALVIFIVYQIIKNKRPAERKVNTASFSSDWNPEKITKTELELLLEAAIESEDYRECVRIYFNFILKELIKKGWIRWKKEKTNYDYILEMKSRENSFLFEECVRIYDLVWYGDYVINKEDFEEVQPILLNYYQLIQKGDK